MIEIENQLAEKHNLLNDLHKELIGGAVMGRQVIMRMTSTF